MTLVALLTTLAVSVQMNQITSHQKHLQVHIALSFCTPSCYGLFSYICMQHHQHSVQLLLHVRRKEKVSCDDLLLYIICITINFGLCIT